MKASEAIGLEAWHSKTYRKYVMSSVVGELNGQRVTVWTLSKYKGATWIFPPQDLPT